MNNGCRYVFWSPIETRRLLWILGIAFGAVLLVQSFQLPYDSIISSLLSAGKVSVSSYGAPVPNKDDFLIPKNGGGGVNTDLGFNNNQSSFEDVLTQNGVSAENTTEKASSKSGNIAPSPGQNVNSGSFSDEKITLEKNLTLASNTSSAKNPSPSNGTLGTTPVVSISQMNELLQESHSSRKSKPRLSFSAVDEELLHARSEIENAPLLHYNSGLYEPLYRNVSKFKRSYELMDTMLKVYIYKEGEKPIFHESILDGIYASEGWFLKLLESNKHFITEDPKKAHLFYLPFSSRLLQQTLYVRNSHSRDNLIEFMKNYVEMLIQKYPFWNRILGQDHFLAACHDWAPAETRGRMLNCLRALCNADIKTGFVIGKDVSLPTVYVRSALNPVNDIGGQSAAKRSILAFFAGYMHGNVRPTLLHYWESDPDMRILGRLPHVKGNKNYIEYMKSSKYCICARGFAVHSPRVVESIFFECVPVIISDNYVPPLFEVLNWESFAVFVLEKDIPDLKKILLSISEDKYLEMKKRVKEVQKHFLWHVEPVKYDLFHMVLHSVWYNRVFRI